MSEELNRKLDLIIELLQSRKPGRKTTENPELSSLADLTRERVKVIEDVFWNIVNAPYEKKRDSYKVPVALLCDRDEPNIEGVVASVLCNQASLRKVFRIAGVGDVHKETPLDRARRALALSNLVVVPLIKTSLGHSKSDVAFSPGEAQRRAYGEVRRALPTPKGWTTEERAVSFRGISVDFVEAPEDDCGVRVWEGVSSEAQEKRVDVPVKSEVVFDREAFRNVDLDSSVDLDEIPDDNDDLLEDERVLLEEEDEQVEVRKPLKINIRLGSENK